MARYAGRYERPLRKLSLEATDALMKHAYPGNVRELENIIEQATVLATGELITLGDLPPSVRTGGPAAPAAALTPGEVRATWPSAWRRSSTGSCSRRRHARRQPEQRGAPPGAHRAGCATSSRSGARVAPRPSEAPPLAVICE
jgi:DNA-binding NtrC family response regulator